MRIVAITVIFLATACLAAAAPLAMAGAAVDTTQQKWATDEPLRVGMLAIRDLVRINHSLVTHRRMPPDHAARFARAIRAQADAILATSTVSGAARERLAEMLNEIVAGVEAVAGRSGGVSPMDGLIRVDEVLAVYPTLFEHPGWAPVQSLE
ncbi:MAG TPA: hypothetical protein VMX97_06560 [Hyphomicrobiaceae bacterium]|nr:hypothetical protein [Hyphomicrobiaceae bacterium]